MFCPKCGSSDQKPETYCRDCGLYLPDLDNLKSPEQPPEMHIKSNAVLSILTILASLTVVGLLIAAFYGRETPVLVYPAGGLLITITAWQIQTFWRTLLLRRQLERDLPRYSEASRGKKAVKTVATGKLLKEVDFENFLQTSVTDRTTKRLARKLKRST